MRADGAKRIGGERAEPLPVQAERFGALQRSIAMFRREPGDLLAQRIRAGKPQSPVDGLEGSSFFRR